MIWDKLSQCTRGSEVTGFHFRGLSFISAAVLSTWLAELDFPNPIILYSTSCPNFLT
ncbi:MAG: hypothetical protein QOG23_445 [Blastocatellia bacterium]|jgi:hypothetical protein|nr:hypothetical protein [Blastocatellia bacterium]